MGMKKKMLSATLCAVMVGSLAAPAFTVQAADDTLVYWSVLTFCLLFLSFRSFVEFQQLFLLVVLILSFLHK